MSAVTLAVSGLTGLAAALLLAPAVPARIQAAPRPWSVGRTGWLAVGAAAGALVLLVEGSVLVLALIVLGAVAGTSLLIARGRARKAADARADRVLELCEGLAGELRAGLPPQRALRHGVEVWPELEPVAAAAELGADAAAAMRRLALLPGASGLRDVASAWLVSEGSGATMSLALSRVADAARERRASQRLVASELASAQATARMVAALPLLVLVMGSGVGGDPWRFLLRTTAGLACLSAGLLLAFVGLWWISRIADAAVEG